MPGVQPSQNTGKSEWVIHSQTPPGLKKETTPAFGQLAGNKGKHRRSSWVCGAERSPSAACVVGERSFAEPHGGNAAGHRTPPSTLLGTQNSSVSSVPKKNVCLLVVSAVLGEHASAPVEGTNMCESVGWYRASGQLCRASAKPGSPQRPGSAFDRVIVAGI